MHKACSNTSCYSLSSKNDHAGYPTITTKHVYLSIVKCEM